MLYKRPERKSSILVDLSPLIDVVFLLLIFFMVSTQFKEDHGLDLALPSSESRSASKEKLLTVFIDKNLVIRVAEQNVAMDSLGEYIRGKLDEYENKMVVLKVDQNVNHGMVVDVMDAAKQAGAAGLTFATMAKSPAGD